MPKTLDDMVKEAELALNEAFGDMTKTERLIKKAERRWKISLAFNWVLVVLLGLNLIVALVK